MSDWYQTELEAGEEVILGVATSSSRSSSSHTQNGRQIESSQHEVERKSGVTNRRVIVEEKGDPGATVVIGNEQVRQAWIERSDFMGTAKLNLVAVQSEAGQRAELNIGFLEASDEARVRELFAHAQVSIGSESRSSEHSAFGTPLGEEKPKKKGLLGLLGF